MIEQFCVVRPQDEKVVRLLQSYLNSVDNRDALPVEASQKKISPPLVEHIFITLLDRLLENGQVDQSDIDDVGINMRTLYHPEDEASWETIIQTATKNAVRQLQLIVELQSSSLESMFTHYITLLPFRKIQ